MNVSVIIPAYNAEKTIRKTLESLCAQTFPGWEAIVVNDGSNDRTAAIVASLAEEDPRIRIVNQPHMGVSAARNTGIRLAQFNWLLFLDADDWILPPMMEQLTGKLLSDPSLDAVFCSWARVTPDGSRRLSEEFCDTMGDLFDVFARFCAFAIHACIVRKSIVEAVGGFDTSLRTCEDWYLWQQIARTGARFGSIREVLSLYCMQPYSASNDSYQFLADGLRVQALGHTLDPCFLNQHPIHANGRPREELPGINFNIACWAAGLALGHGDDARPLLNMLKDICCPELNPHEVAASIFKATLLPSCRTPADWIELWPRFEKNINEFLLALENHSMASGLAHRTRVILERLILQHMKTQRLLTIGTTHAVRIEITEPISDVTSPATAERFYCMVELEGIPIGTVELPICDGLVPHYVIADSIAAEFAWQILNTFFWHTVYRKLNMKRDENGMSIWRGTLCLADGLPNNDDTLFQHIHDRVGWTIFMQELWARPEWPIDYFYNPKAIAEQVPLRKIEDGWLMIEVGEEVPDISISGQKLNVVLTVGGIVLGVVTFSPEQNIIRAHEIRAALTKASGFELCRAAVREGLLGKPITKPISLHDRLAVASATAKQASSVGLDPAVYAETVSSSGSFGILNSLLSSGKGGMLLTRRIYHEFGTSVSRRAMLPSDTARELADTAAVVGEHIISIPGPDGKTERIIYLPDLIYPKQYTPISNPLSNKQRTVRPKEAAVHGRSHFETIFATKSDPWQYTSPYEQTKYEQTLSLLPSIQIRRALELACAEGHFTVQLAPRVDNLIAADISTIALSRAAKRCSGLKNINFVNIDLTKDPLPGRFDLIVCSEVLYYVDGREALKAIAQKFTDALEPEGYILLAHANLVVDEPDRPGFDWNNPFGAKVIGETFASIPSLILVKELRTPLYRIQLFQRSSSMGLPHDRKNPEVIELAHQPTSLLPEVAAHVLWHGGNLRHDAVAQAVITDRLPILMYHRIAPAGSSMTARYRITPDTFDEQLRYLHDAGYYSIRLEDWYAAIQTRKPLSGRAVLITFDDGYLDFLTYTWPLLKRYGFSATVFLVAGEIGQSNRWNIIYGENIPLLGWKDILQLQDEGIEFGSHSISHTRMTALSPAEIVREAVCSRAILQKGLGTPIRAFAYPFGEEDRPVQHLIGACGYVFGLSCQRRLSSYYDPLLALPRLEVLGSDNLQEFVAMLDMRQTRNAG